MLGFLNGGFCWKFLYPVAGIVGCSLIQMVLLWNGDDCAQCASYPVGSDIFLWKVHQHTVSRDDSWSIAAPLVFLIPYSPFSPRLSYPALTSSPPDESPLPAKWFWRRLGHLHVEIRCFDPFFIHKEQQRSWCVCVWEGPLGQGCVGLMMFSQWMVIRVCMELLKYDSHGQLLRTSSSLALLKEKHDAVHLYHLFNAAAHDV